MTYVKAAVLLSLVAGLYWDVLANLASEWWHNDAASHGMLVPPLAAGLAWLRRGAILQRPATHNARGIYVVAAGCILLVTGKLAAEFFLSRVSLVVVIAGLVLTFWGSARLRILVFPLLLLLTMIPLPAIVFNRLATPLQLLASDISTELAQLGGVAVYREGNVIHLAQMTLGVAEACSGLHSLSALLVAALLLGVFYVRAPGSRAGLFVVAIPIAIGVNVLRVTATAILADYRPESALGFYHLFSGWMMFLLGFAMLWAVAKLLDRVFPGSRSNLGGGAAQPVGQGH